MVDNVDTANLVRQTVGEHGLILRGGFVFNADEDAPGGPSGRPAQSAVLIGQGGAANWRHFQTWYDSYSSKPDNPLDTWSREVICAIAQQVSARAVFPSDKPWHPFQQWAMRAEALKSSPLGILIHPDYGLWHAYRGALLFDEAIELPPPNRVHPCDACDPKPCLSACPVGAMAPSHYDVPACAKHVVAAAGEQCRSTGCLARNACPVGVEHRYPDDVQAFHMAAFLANNALN